MSITPNSTTAASTIEGRPHRSKRLRSFVLPGGREVHIALSPEEARTLRQRLETIKREEPFDLVISGSAEHLEALRSAHDHHEQRRQRLREQHGENFEEWERVREELDALSVDLHMLSDHAVSLDANFSKYGYDAHLRTYDDNVDSSQSSAHGHDDSEHEHKDWEAEKFKGRIFKLYKKPVVRQYFHRGLLWRASETTQVATFELFLDLIYVGIIAINGDRAAEQPTGDELHRFAITFIMSWRIWTDITVVISWFIIDDIFQRVSVLFVMACLVGLTTNMIEAFETTYSQLIAFYLAARLTSAAYYAFLAFIIPMVRGTMINQVITIVIPSIIWIGSIYVEMPQRFALIWIALLLDLFAAMFAVFLLRGSERISSRLHSWVQRVFEFYPAVNIEHKTERTNAFVTLIFGYSVVALLYQNAAAFGVNAFYGKAVLGLVQAFCFNTLYFEIDGDSLWQHAIRRNVYSSMSWVSAHLPFLLGYSLAGASLSKLVVAHDCPDTDEQYLTELYVQKSSDRIEDGLRWFYCGGLGIALISMGFISMSHIHREVGGIRIKKSHRLVNRFAVSIVILCLPLAKGLNSLYLIMTTTILVVWVLLLELFGASCPQEGFFGGAGKSAKYTARCKMQRKDVEHAVKSGEVVKVQELSHTGEKGLYELS